jgi:tetratricopeptide (TPR) repeat protein
MTVGTSNRLDVLSAALGLHQQGRLDEAEALYQQLLAADPGHAEALHMLGVLAHQRGRPPQAVELMTRALALQPDNVPCQLNLAEAYRATGDLDRASAHCREALRLQPDSAEAHNKLGLLLQQLGRADEAAAHFEAARASRPSWPLPHLNLANLLLAQGRREEAAAVFRAGAGPCGAAGLVLLTHLGRLLLEMDQPQEALVRAREAVRLCPDDPNLLSNLGQVLTVLERTEEARAAYQQAIRQSEQRGYDAARLAQSSAQVGLLLQAEGRFDEALAWFSEAARRDPNNPRFPCHAAGVLAEQDRHDEALARLRELLRHWPDDAEAHNNLGYLLQDRGDLAGALAAYREALRLKPDFAAALLNLGQLHAVVGEQEQALAAYRAVLRLQPDDPDALAALATALRGRLPAEETAACERVLARTTLAAKNRATLQYGLAQVLDARGQFARAADLARRANDWSGQDARRRGQGYDPAEDHAYVERIIRACPSAFFEQVRGWGLSRGDAEVPVFVVGLPRSGTSLVEQILASHPHVFGAGELTYLFDISRAFPSLPPRQTTRGKGPRKKGAPTPGRLDRATVQALARQYLDRVRALAPRAVRIVDKMPDNYQMLGLIATLLPKAHVIHVRRDLRDVALSCWLTNFARVRWAYTVEDIAARIREYQRLLEHWRRVLPLPILEIDYEEIVADLEPAARRLVAWCGLPWDPACLAFHQTKRPVQTASVHQVREPLYRRSVGRWRHYQDVLAPLLKMLGSESRP